MTPLLALSTWAPPTICRRCDAMMREDTRFTIEMRAGECAQRRYVCMSGHSVYTGLAGMQEVRHSNGAPVSLPNQASGSQRVCARCGEAFRGTKRQKFCSTVCTRAADKERNKTYIAHRSSQLDEADA